MYPYIYIYIYMHLYKGGVTDQALFHSNAHGKV